MLNLLFFCSSLYLVLPLNQTLNIKLTWELFFHFCRALLTKYSIPYYIPCLKLPIKICTILPKKHGKIYIVYIVCFFHIALSLDNISWRIHSNIWYSCPIITIFWFKQLTGVSWLIQNKQDKPGAANKGGPGEPYPPTHTHTHTFFLSKIWKQ